MLNETDKIFEKQQLVVRINELKILGLSWKNGKDLLAVEILSEIKKLIK